MTSDLIIHNKDSGKVTIIEIVMPAPTINLPLSLGGCSSTEQSITLTESPCDEEDLSVIRVQFPDQTIYTCPVCDSQYAIFSSWTRHLRNKHDLKPTLVFVCSGWDLEFTNKKTVTSHYNREHGASGLMGRFMRTSPSAGDYPCNF